MAVISLGNGAVKKYWCTPSEAPIKGLPPPQYLLHCTGRRNGSMARSSDPSTHDGELTADNASVYIQAYLHTSTKLRKCLCQIGLWGIFLIDDFG